MAYVEFTFTNEDLEAIVTGLDVKQTDAILSIGGSGDQPFALLENANSVKAIEWQQAQVDFIKARLDFLSANDYESFIWAGLEDKKHSLIPGSLLDRRNKYFKSRFDRIKSRAQKLSIAEPSNIFDVLEKESGFGKVYLSNALGWSYKAYSGMTLELLSISAGNLPKNGLVYVSNHDNVLDFLLSGRIIPAAIAEMMPSEFYKNLERCFGWLGFPINLGYSFIFPKMLVVDTKLSNAARRYEKGFFPAVYRKIA